VPNMRTYCDVYYSQDALNNVDTMIQTRPFRWQSWREAE
jgi:hypothetical protein